jgi:hypothetical protein
MGFLNNLFNKPKPLLQLHSGSFSMDRNGRVLATTLPSSFPRKLTEEIGQSMAATFEQARAAQLPLDEIVVNYPALQIKARDMRGGAMVFLTTQNMPGDTLTKSTHNKS